MRAKNMVVPGVTAIAVVAIAFSAFTLLGDENQPEIGPAVTSERSATPSASSEPTPKPTPGAGSGYDLSDPKQAEQLEKQQKKAKEARAKAKQEPGMVVCLTQEGTIDRVIVLDLVSPDDAPPFTDAEQDKRCEAAAKRDLRD